MSGTTNNYIGIIFEITLTAILLLIAFRIIRFIINYVIYIKLAIKYRPKKYKAPKNYKPKPSNKTDFKRRDQKHELMAAMHDQRKDLANASEYEIVGIAEPIGKWTKYVTSQKINWLKAMIGTKVDSDQFWQNMIKAQQKANSRHKGKSGPGI